MNEWTKAILTTLLGGSGAILISGIINRRSNSATADSIVVQSSTTVVQMLRDQMAAMQDQIRILQSQVDLANEKAARLEIHVEHLEDSIRQLGGQVPERPRDRRR